MKNLTKPGRNTKLSRKKFKLHTYVLTSTILIDRREKQTLECLSCSWCRV